MKAPVLLWVTDPWDTLDHAQDTSLRIAEEGFRQDLNQYWCNVQSIRLESQTAFVDAQKIVSVSPGRLADGFKLGPIQKMEVSRFGRVLYRTDPPVDQAFLHPLLIFRSDRSLQKTKTVFINPLNVLLGGNEKLEGALIEKAMPPSIAASQWSALQAFGKTYGRTVLKPLHEAQSKGVELLDWRAKDGVEHAKIQLIQSTRSFTTPVLLQRYLEGISEGEVRLWYLDGKLLSSIRKLPLTGDFRVNMDGGSRVAKTRLTAKERRMAEKIGKHLALRKITLAAVDLIEGWVTDFNFTSPGLICQMESVLQENLARPILKTLLRPRSN